MIVVHSFVEERQGLRQIRLLHSFERMISS